MAIIMKFEIVVCIVSIKHEAHITEYELETITKQQVMTDRPTHNNIHSLFNH